MISDGQSPTVASFATGTISPYGGFYSGALALSYTLAETMAGGGVTKILFTHNGGNIDVNSPHVYNISDPTKLTAGGKTVSVDLSSIGLVSGASYDVKLIGSDLAGNSITSSALTPIKFDNI